MFPWSRRSSVTRYFGQSVKQTAGRQGLSAAEVLRRLEEAASGEGDLHYPDTPCLDAVERAQVVNKEGPPLARERAQHLEQCSLCATMIRDDEKLLDQAIQIGQQLAATPAVTIQDPVADARAGARQEHSEQLERLRSGAARPELRSVEPPAITNQGGLTEFWNVWAPGVARVQFLRTWAPGVARVSMAVAGVFLVATLAVRLHIAGRKAAPTLRAAIERAKNGELVIIDGFAGMGIPSSSSDGTNKGDWFVVGKAGTEEFQLAVGASQSASLRPINPHDDQKIFNVTGHLRWSDKEQKPYAEVGSGHFPLLVGLGTPSPQGQDQDRGLWDSMAEGLRNSKFTTPKSVAASEQPLVIPVSPP